MALLPAMTTRPSVSPSLTTFDCHAIVDGRGAIHDDGVGDCRQGRQHADGGVVRQVEVNSVCPQLEWMPREAALAFG